MIRSVRASALLATAALTVSSAGCVQLSLSRYQANEPIADERVAEARQEIGTLDLEACLARFGAPQIVREHPLGPVLLWGWKDEFNWGLSLSVSLIDQGPSASVDWDSGDANIEAMALFFDDDLVLHSVRRGLLRDLVHGDRIRPQLIE